MSELAISTLRAVSTTNDSFPPLKSAADGALWVATNVKSNKHHKAEWAAFANYIQQGVACVLVIASKDAAPLSPSLEAHLRSLETAVNSVTTDMRSYMAPNSFTKRVRARFRNRRRIQFYTTTIDRALSLFNLGGTISAHQVYAHLLETSTSTTTNITNVSHEITRVGHGVVHTLSHRANLDLLPYASGAAWNPQHGVLPGTRTGILEEIMQFVRDTTAKTSQALVLEGPLGIGKTALANTVAKMCAEADDITLLSSFFFKKGVSGRDTPDLLWSTIAHDLSKKANLPALADMISTAIERDKSLLSPPLAQQFEQLILRPAKAIFASPSPSPARDRGLSASTSSRRSTTAPSEMSAETVMMSAPSNSPGQQQQQARAGPFVIVIDALDEGCSEDLLQILVEGIPQLPPCFRFVIMTRPTLPISSALRSSSSSGSGSHYPSAIITHPLVQDAACREDVATYARHALSKIRDARQLGDEWPGEELEDKFAAKAREGGLFTWVSVVCEYLATRSVNPAGQLEKLLANHADERLSPSGMMEKLDASYAELLAGAPWEDEDFANAYQGVFASLLCMKQPLTARSLDAVLGGGLKSSDVLRPLSSLLTGLSGDDDTVVQLIDPSIRDFVTRRAAHGANSTNARYAIDTSKTEESLALRTLRILNAELPLIYPQSTPISVPVTHSLTPPATPKVSPSPLARPRMISFNYPSQSVSLFGSGAAATPSTPPAAPPAKLAAPAFSTTPSGSPAGIRSFSASMSYHYRSRARSPSEATNTTSVSTGVTGGDVLSPLSFSASTAASSMPMQASHSRATSFRSDTSGYLHEQVHLSPPLVSPSIKFTDAAVNIQKLTLNESEALAYARQYWLAHLCAVSEPGEELLDALSTFLRSSLDASQTHCLESNFMRWIRLDATLRSTSAHATAVGVEQAVAALRTWCKSVEYDLWSHVDRTHLATYLHGLSAHLREGITADSQEESKTATVDSSLDALREAIALRRELVADEPKVAAHPAMHSSELASSLHALSELLASRASSSPAPSAYPFPSTFLYPSAAKDRAEALASIHEAVTLRRKLAAVWPALYNPALANSLNEFAQRLDEGGVGHPTDADDRRQEADAARAEAKMLLGGSPRTSPKLVPAPPSTQGSSPSPSAKSSVVNLKVANGTEAPKIAAPSTPERGLQLALEDNPALMNSPVGL